MCQSEVDECASSPCQNGAICIDMHADFACACPFGNLTLFYTISIFSSSQHHTIQITIKTALNPNLNIWNTLSNLRNRVFQLFHPYGTLEPISTRQFPKLLSFLFVSFLLIVIYIDSRYVLYVKSVKK